MVRDGLVLLEMTRYRGDFQRELAMDVDWIIGWARRRRQFSLWHDPVVGIHEHRISCLPFGSLTPDGGVSLSLSYLIAGWTRLVSGVTW